MGPVTTTTTRTEAKSPLWRKENRAASVGLVMLITLAAFEHLGVSTAMPKMLAGRSPVSWPRA